MNRRSFRPSTGAWCRDTSNGTPRERLRLAGLGCFHWQKNLVGRVECLSFWVSLWMLVGSTLIASLVSCADLWMELRRVICRWSLRYTLRGVDKNEMTVAVSGITSSCSRNKISSSRSRNKSSSKTQSSTFVPSPAAKPSFPMFVPPVCCLPSLLAGCFTSLDEQAKRERVKARLVLFWASLEGASRWNGGAAGNASWETVGEATSEAQLFFERSLFLPERPWKLWDHSI